MEVRQGTVCNYVCMYLWYVCMYLPPSPVYVLPLSGSLEISELGLKITNHQDIYICIQTITNSHGLSTDWCGVYIDWVVVRPIRLPCNAAQLRPIHPRNYSSSARGNIGIH